MALTVLVPVWKIGSHICRAKAKHCLRLPIRCTVLNSLSSNHAILHLPKIKFKDRYSVLSRLWEELECAGESPEPYSKDTDTGWRPLRVRHGWALPHAPSAALPCACDVRGIFLSSVFTPQCQLVAFVPNARLGTGDRAVFPPLTVTLALTKLA